MLMHWWSLNACCFVKTHVIQQSFIKFWMISTLETCLLPKIRTCFSNLVCMVWWWRMMVIVIHDFMNHGIWYGTGVTHVVNAAVELDNYWPQNFQYCKIKLVMTIPVWFIQKLLSIWFAPWFHCSNFHLFVCLLIDASIDDDYDQKLFPHIDDAIEFIGMSNLYPIPNLNLNLNRNRNPNPSISSKTIKAAHTIASSRKPNQTVLVHCAAGASRSVAIILAYFIKHLRCPLFKAFKFIHSIRPQAAPSYEFMQQLGQFETSVLGGSKSSLAIERYQRWKKFRFIELDELQASPNEGSSEEKQHQSISFSSSPQATVPVSTNTTNSPNITKTITQAAITKSEKRKQHLSHRRQRKQLQRYLQRKQRQQPANQEQSIKWEWYDNIQSPCRWMQTTTTTTTFDIVFFSCMVQNWIEKRIQLAK